MDQDVGVLQEQIQVFEPFWAFKVEGNGFFTAIEEVKIKRIAATKCGTHVARIITAFALFNLQHLSAQVTQDGTSKGGRQDLTEFHHPYAIQGQGAQIFMGGLKRHVEI
jgi:hypothetical protein